MKEGPYEICYFECMEEDLGNVLIASNPTLPRMDPPLDPETPICMPPTRFCDTRLNLPQSMSRYYARPNCYPFHPQCSPCLFKSPSKSADTINHDQPLRSISELTYLDAMSPLNPRPPASHNASLLSQRPSRRIQLAIKRTRQWRAAE